MNPWFAFILGLLIGWLIEWLIDFFYWRRRRVEKETVYVPQPPVQVRVPERGDVEPRPAPQAVPDDLKIIKGIGSVIERKLNEAGITTFEQLGNLPPPICKGLWATLLIGNHAYLWWQICLMDSTQDWSAETSLNNTGYFLEPVQ